MKTYYINLKLESNKKNHTLYTVELSIVCSLFLLYVKVYINVNEIYQLKCIINKIHIINILYGVKGIRLQIHNLIIGDVINEEHLEDFIGTYS